jgi:3',5'-cyclic AMP phosphodiesterase CpdA
MKQNHLILMLVFLALVVTAKAQEIRVYKSPRFDSTWSKPSIYPDRIVINFGQDPTSQVNITWRTNAEIDTAFAEIALATAAPKFWRNAKTLQAKTEAMDATAIQSAAVLSHHHSVEFTGLIPDTTYAYRVGDGERWSEWFHFRTASQDLNKKFSFLYLGDAQNYILELWARLIRQGFKTAPDASFIVHAGDLISNAHSEQEWEEWFYAGNFIHSMLPSLSTPGNHEYRPITQVEADAGERTLSVQWRPHFTLPLNGPKEYEDLKETVYYMDYQDMRIISLNSNRKQAEQIPWLENVLANNTKKWTVITYHHPLFSASDGRDNERLRNLWKPIFDKYKVDLVLQGHDHSYARGRVSPGENVIDGVNLRDQTGTVYVVSVSGGKMYNIGKDWTALGAERERIAENTQLFQVITIEGDRLRFEAYTAIGELYDAFDLIHNGTAPNKFIELRANAVPEKYHATTIPYQDPLPENVKMILLQRYPQHAITNVNAVKEGGNIFFNVRLDKGDTRVNTKVDMLGNEIK